uniref:PPM-type phosphatase domain-containing protein n=1 Tax=Calcidiscus leptoporus TaxID=127549 RepID=A0A7S0JIY6_9EUKA|mmetsp:Transcript_60248/g.138236  ORF Transcript_60248/g.138236 Transcript_60248/m.138236 type:complete len:342 (+) Transcript_60248:203-1228(+)
MGAKHSKKKGQGETSVQQPSAPTPAAPVKPSKGLAESRILQTECFAFSDPGFGAVDEENQDMALAATRLPGDDAKYVAGIFDGHGPEGRAVAMRIKERVVSVLAANKCRHNSHTAEDMVGEEADAPATTSEAPGTTEHSLQFVRSFMELEAACISIHSDSGACATIVVFDETERRLLIANVGDSKAVLGRVKEPLMVQLTEDHYPSVKEERERIVAAGGRVAAAIDVQFGELGPPRVWKGDSDSPGLPLSRTIGDALAKEIGVTATPHVADLVLTPEDRFLIVGSSGMWKVLTPQETVEVVSKQTDVKSAAKKLVDEAKRRYEVLWQGENTSALVIAFPVP